MAVKITPDVWREAETLAVQGAKGRVAFCICRSFYCGNTLSQAGLDGGPGSEVIARIPFSSPGRMTAWSLGMVGVQRNFLAIFPSNCNDSCTITNPLSERKQHEANPYFTCPECSRDAVGHAIGFRHQH